MFSKVRKVLFAGAVVAGLAAYANGCAVIGTVDFDITFKPPQATNPSLKAVDCRTANVNTVRFEFLDQALDGMLRTRVDRPCVPGERYRVSIDLGPYNIRLQGMNGGLVICYETNQLYTVVAGKTEVLTFSADAHPAGVTGGCQYPTIAP